MAEESDKIELDARDLLLAQRPPPEDLVSLCNYLEKHVRFLYQGCDLLQFLTQFRNTSKPKVLPSFSECFKATLLAFNGYETSATHTVLLP